MQRCWPAASPGLQLLTAPAGDGPGGCSAGRGGAGTAVQPRGCRRAGALQGSARGERWGALPEAGAGAGKSQLRAVPPRCLSQLGGQGGWLGQQDHCSQGEGFKLEMRVQGAPIAQRDGLDMYRGVSKDPIWFN